MTMWQSTREMKGLRAHVLRLVGYGTTLGKRGWMSRRKVTLVHLCVHVVLIEKHHKYCQLAVKPIGTAQTTSPGDGRIDHSSIDYDWGSGERLAELESSEAGSQN